jgi:ATP-binding cassette subfamily C (CFTR/MRP) protein 1
VLATHKVRHLPEADNIVVLGEDGSIIEQGNFEHLNTEQGYVQSLIVEDQAEKSYSNTVSDTVTKSKKEAAEKAVEDTSASDLLRKTGDLTLYKYYLKSVGWKDGIVILTLTFSSQFCQYFPRGLLFISV